MAKKEKDADLSANNASNNEFPSERFQGRLYGFSWVLLETRDPSYNPESLKREHHLLWVLKALDFATDKEKAVFDKLVEIIGNKKNRGNERLALLGAVEGKKVVYQGISPELFDSIGINVPPVSETNVPPSAERNVPLVSD